MYDDYRYEMAEKTRRLPYNSESNNNKPICNVYASVTEGDSNASCDYDYTHIENHYHININIPENINTESLKQVLNALRQPEKLPETDIVEKDPNIIVTKRKGRNFFSKISGRDDNTMRR